MWLIAEFVRLVFGLVDSDVQLIELGRCAVYLMLEEWFQSGE